MKTKTIYAAIDELSHLADNLELCAFDLNTGMLDTFIKRLRELSCILLEPQPVADGKRLNYFVGSANGRGLIRIETDDGEHIASMPRGEKSEQWAKRLVDAYNAESRPQGDATIADQIYDDIHSLLSLHTLLGFGDDEEGAFPLVDHLSSGDDISTGKVEIDHICDAIYNDVLIPALTKTATAAHGAPSTQNVLLEQLYSEFDRRRNLPKHHEDWICIDDTQAGIEFAHRFITTAAHGVPE